jgi:hypothetical protein
MRNVLDTRILPVRVKLYMFQYFIIPLILVIQCCQFLLRFLHLLSICTGYSKIQIPMTYNTLRQVLFSDGQERVKHVLQQRSSKAKNRSTA